MELNSDRKLDFDFSIPIINTEFGLFDLLSMDCTGQEKSEDFAPQLSSITVGDIKEEFNNQEHHQMDINGASGSSTDEVIELMINVPVEAQSSTEDKQLIVEGNTDVSSSSEEGRISEVDLQFCRLSQKRKKKYQEDPFEDEEEERKRLNAKKARENRLKKKKVEEDHLCALSVVQQERSSLFQEKLVWVQEKKAYEEKERQWNKREQQWLDERTAYIKNIEFLQEIIRTSGIIVKNPSRSYGRKGKRVN